MMLLRIPLAVLLSGLDRDRGLFVSQFNEGDPVWDCCTVIEVACTGFGFSSGGEDVFVTVVTALKEALKN